MWETLSTIMIWEKYQKRLKDALFLSISLKKYRETLSQFFKKSIQFHQWSAGVRKDCSVVQFLW